MNRPGRKRTVGKAEVVAASPRWTALQVEEGLVGLLFSALLLAAILMLFMMAYRLVDDPLVAGVIATLVPMIFLPLFRKAGAN